MWCCNNGCFLPMTDCCILVWGLPLFDIACVTDTVTPITYIWSNQRLTGVLCLNLATCSCSGNKDCSGSFGTTAMQLPLSKSSRAGRRSHLYTCTQAPYIPLRLSSTHNTNLLQTIVINCVSSIRYRDSNSLPLNRQYAPKTSAFRTCL